MANSPAGCAGSRGRRACAGSGLPSRSRTRPAWGVGGEHRRGTALADEAPHKNGERRGGAEPELFGGAVELALGVDVCSVAKGAIIDAATLFLLSVDCK